MGSNPVVHFVKFSMDANIDIKKIGDSMKKYLLSYQRNILHQPAFKTLFGEMATNTQSFECRLVKDVALV